MKCLTFIGLNMSSDSRIYLLVRLVGLIFRSITDASPTYLDITKCLMPTLCKYKFFLFGADAYELQKLPFVLRLLKKQKKLNAFLDHHCKIMIYFFHFSL